MKRKFMQAAATLAVLSLLVLNSSRADEPAATNTPAPGAAARVSEPMKKKPNILIIICDQLTQRAIGAYGDAQRRTPTIDSIAARGVRFANTYTPCPICMPARASLWTGQLPHRTGVRHNGKKMKAATELTTLGDLFSGAGYECVHSGKQHDNGTLRGFKSLPERWNPKTPITPTPPWKTDGDALQDRCVTEEAVEFLSKSGDKPFLFVADYNNPHDICLWVGENKGVHVDKPVPVVLPPLPDNFEDADLATRTIAVRRNCCGNFRVAQTQGWTGENFRYYLAAYYHYLEMVDREIATVLEALAKRPDAENTLIVFTSDHGDAMASHKMVTKGYSLYEESTRVPLIVAGPGVAEPAREVGSLASLLDVMPTLCEYAGIEAPKDLSGRSLLPLLTQRGNFTPPEYVVSTWYGNPELTTPSRMIRTERYKYTHFREDNVEELYDLANDPGEKRNLAADPAHASVLEQHRKLLREHVAKTGDTYFDEPVIVGKGRRTHPDGECPFTQ